MDFLLELALLRGDLVGLLLVELDAVHPELASRLDAELVSLQLEVREGLDQPNQREVALLVAALLGAPVAELEGHVLLLQLLLERVGVEYAAVADILLLVLLGEDLCLDLRLVVEDGLTHLLPLDRVEVDKIVELVLEWFLVKLGRFFPLDLLVDIGASAVLLDLEAFLLEPLALAFHEVGVVVYHVVLGHAKVLQDLGQEVIRLDEGTLDVVGLLWLLPEEL